MKTIKKESSLHLVDDITGVILLVISILIGISLLSYSSDDPSFFESSFSVRDVKNLIGVVGSHTADLLLQAIGAASYLLPFFLSAFGVQKLFYAKQFTTSKLHISGLVLATLASAVVLQAHLDSLFDMEGMLPSSRNGGVVGEILLNWMLFMFGSVGSQVVAFSILLIALIFLLPVPLSTVIFAAFGTTKKIAVKGKNGISRIGEKKQGFGNMPVESIIAKSNISEEIKVKKNTFPKIIKQEPKTEEADEKWLISDAAKSDTFTLPSLSLLKDIPVTKEPYSKKELLDNAELLGKKLLDYDVKGRVTQVHPGPVITMFEFEPAPGVKINRIANLSNDIALVMKAIAVRIVAPIPGKAVIGIEIPNVHRQMVSLKDVLVSSEFQKSTHVLPMALGKDIFGKPICADLRTMPHLLIAGATGAGKSVGLNSMICSLLYLKTPSDIRMLLIDPKMLELVTYEDIPHLISPIVVDPKQAIAALKKMVVEMERRYMLLSASGVRNLEGYNELEKDKEKILGKLLKNSETDISDYEIPDRLPHIVVVVDELADLMLTSAKQVEEPIARLAQMARAAGIHLILATQRPSVNVLTGVIKANFPARIAFQVSSQIDSRTIIDCKGAEQLLGMGDMLFLHPKTGKLTRIHGTFISDQEIEMITDFLREQPKPAESCNLLSTIPGEEIEQSSGEPNEASAEDRDEIYQKSVDLVLSTRKASASFIQRRLRIGYPRAARMIEQMESDGMIGPSNGSRPREILVNHYEDVDG